MSEHATEVSRYVEPEEQLTYETWAQALEEDGVLLGQRCGDCGHATGAPKAACAQCGSRDVEAIQLPTQGTVYSESQINATPESFEDAYKVGLVDLGEARIMAHFAADVAIGDEVELVGAIDDSGSPGPTFGRK